MEGLQPVPPPVPPPSSQFPAPRRRIVLPATVSSDLLSWRKQIASAPARQGRPRT
jgi:hypothetical protein